MDSLVAFYTFENDKLAICICIIILRQSRDTDISEDAV